MNFCNTWGPQMRKHSFSFLVIMLATGLLASPVLAQGIFNGTVLDDEGNPSKVRR